MDQFTVPHKVRTEVATFEGEWTAEEIDAGLAGDPVIESSEEWYEPSADGPVLVTDPERIRELESKLKAK